MGDAGDNAEKFKYDTTSDTAETSTYQFVVDFSQAAGSLSGDLDIGMELVPNSERKGNHAPAIKNSTGISMKSPATFAITASEDNGKTATLICTYKKSDGAASVWDYRNTALVLTAPSDIPSDLYMTATVGTKTVTVYRTGKNEFIIPMSSLGDISTRVTLKLYSDMLTSAAKEYKFDARWYVSSSVAAASPKNGYLAASTNVTFKAVKESAASLKVTGDRQLYTVGDTISLTIDYLNKPANANVRAEIQRKDAHDEYHSVTETNIFTYRGAKFTSKLTVSGSYRLVARIETGSEVLLEVPYYFIVLNKDGTVS
jgi:hypothetical protein